MSTEADIVEKGVSVHLDLINSTPALLSVLYDANLMPEQITTICDAIRLDVICTLWERRDTAARDMQERALARIEQLRISAACNLKDANCQGQRGQDRTDALYDAYQAVRSIGAAAVIATEGETKP